MNSSKFPSDFRPVSSQEWKMALQAGLKGGDYNTLLTATLPDGIHIKPFYNQEDLPLNPSESYPERTPWKIGTLMDSSGANATFQSSEDWQEGVDTWFLPLPPTQTDWPDWMKRQESWPEEVLTFPANPYHFSFSHCPSKLTGKMAILLDPIGQFASTGNWIKSKSHDLESLPDLVDRIRASGLSPQILISVEHYQQAGATAVQEIAYALAHAREYMLQAQKTSTGKPWFGTPVFRLALGGEYFSDIAKIRALRQGWAILAQSANLPTPCRIWVHPSLRNKTRYDYNTNLLRTSLECMAGILGGADLIMNLPYDAVYAAPNPFSDRLARNQLLVLRHEAGLHKVANPADGAFFIAHLTDQFGKKALNVLKDIENGGGLIAQLRTHRIQKKIKQRATEEQNAFNTGERVLVGSNYQPNPEEVATATEQRKEIGSGKKTEIEPLQLKRLAQGYEQKRSKDESR